jgi:hypothetical protein
MSPAHELALHLAASGVGTFAGVNGSAWSINVSREPAKPANCITVYDTGGLDPLEIGIGSMQPTIQVRVRCQEYPEGYAKHREIYELLVPPVSRIIGGHEYVGIFPQGDIGDLGRTDNDLFVLTANYRVNRNHNGAST